MARIDAERKIAGLLVPVFALRRDQDLGVGDTLSVEEAIDFLAAHRISVLQLLPVNETSGDNSPYNAISSIALEPSYITMVPDMVPGLSAAILEKFVRPEMSHSFAGPAVDYPLVKKLKLELLRAAFDAYVSGSDAGGADNEFAAFEKAQADWLEDYSIFRALIDHHGGNSCWTMWPEEHSSPAKARAWMAQTEQGLATDCRFYRFVQWVAFSQWGRVRRHADQNGVGLMGDIPFGVSRYSADVWSDPASFDLKWSGGAPPEKFFQSDEFTRRWGQNWGIPLYNWKELEKNDYSFWTRRVRKCAEIFNYFRIDHVLGFFRIYAFPWIPELNWEFAELTEEEAEERTGGLLPRFVERPDEPASFAKLNCSQGEKLLKMILAAAPECGVVAEDLGMVPDYVRPALKKLGIPGFTIPIFERDESDRSFVPMEEHPQLSLITYGTHDHQPIASFYEELCRWWHGENGHEGWLEVQRFMRFLGLDEDNPPEKFTSELHRTMIDVLMDSPCWLAVLMVSDLLGTGDRFNEPGIAGSSNWSRRLTMSLDEYARDPHFGQCIGWLDRALTESGRISQPGDGHFKKQQAQGCLG